MSTIVTRSGKGSPLTNAEVDSNFENLNTDKAELSGAVFTGAITTNSTIDGRDVAADGVTADAALPKSGGAMTGAITTNSTFDGRDVATDGTKLDGIEASATADQTGAQIKTAYEAETNAFTDAQFTKLGGIEASATADQTAAEIRALVESATDSNVFTDADHTKLNGIEASADVTDATNVTAAGALMDSELTSIASVKALNQGVASGDSPTFAALTSTGEITANGGIALGDNDKATFGASDDLQIYHDGSNSYITDVGIGDLYIKGGNDLRLQTPDGEAGLTVNQNGSVQVYHDNAEKLATTSTGIGVTGTATMDGLTVDGNVDINGGYLDIGPSSGNIGKVGFDSNNVYIGSSSGTGQIIFKNNISSTGAPHSSGDTKMVISDSGVGIGVSPSHPLHITKEIAGYQAYFNNDNGSGQGVKVRVKANDSGNFNMLELVSASSGSDVTAMVVRDDGNVGIGATPDAWKSVWSALDIGVSGSLFAQDNNTTGLANNLFFNGSNWVHKNTGATAFYQQSEGLHLFYSNASQSAGATFAPTERARITSDGHFIVGNTSAFDSSSFCVDQSGLGQFRRDGTPLIVRRDGSFGDLISFEDDGTSVGSIGTYSGDLTIGNGNTVGLIFEQTGSDRISPWNLTTNATRDGEIDLGDSDQRFKDLYLSGRAYINNGIKIDGGSGIYFGQDGSSANKLDDYEEVSFTATLKGAAAEPSTLLTATGFATKIGRVVQYSIGFENVYTGGYAGAINIYGLPFANKGARAMGSMVGYLGLTFTDDQAFSVIEVNATTLSLKSVSSNSVWNNCTHNAGSGRYFWLTGTYVTT